MYYQGLFKQCNIIALCFFNKKCFFKSRFNIISISLRLKKKFLEKNRPKNTELKDY